MGGKKGAVTSRVSEYQVPVGREGGNTTAEWAEGHPCTPISCLSPLPLIDPLLPYILTRSYRFLRQEAHAKFEALPLCCQAPLLNLLEMEACVAMNAGRGEDAYRILRRMTAIEDAVEGVACFFRLNTFRTRVRLVYSALMAGRDQVAETELRALALGCCHPPQVRGGL